METDRVIRKKQKKLLWVIVPMAILLFYYVFNPLESGWMPQCVFHKLTGLQCMGCGSQRMLHALLHGNIQEAMHANMFLFFSMPVILFLIYVELNRTRHPILYKIFHTLPVIIIISVMLVSWLFVRNIYGL